MVYQSRMPLVQPTIERRWRPSFELLIGLFATGTPGEPRDESWAPPAAADCPPRTRRALKAVGERAGEIWLHVLGLALDVETPADRLAALIAASDPVEVRRYLVGAYVPAWRTIAGAEVLEAAAEGDPAASRALLREPRYYAGRAQESLRTLLPLDPEETRGRLAEAVAAFHDELFPSLELDVSAPVPDGDELVDGYRYVAEAGLDRVILIPQLAARPWLLLCQHRTARVVCHPAAQEESTASRLLKLGRALGDERRVAMLLRLRRGEATLQELADELGLAKSTVHHHAAQLRAAGLIALRGNAQRYAYVLDTAGVDAALSVLEQIGHRTNRR